MASHQCITINLYCKVCGNLLSGESERRQGVWFSKYPEPELRHYLWCENCGWHKIDREALNEIEVALSQL